VNEIERCFNIVFASSSANPLTSHVKDRSLSAHLKTHLRSAFGPMLGKPGPRAEPSLVFQQNGAAEPRLTSGGEATSNGSNIPRAHVQKFSAVLSAVL
jgi:hypothetical protein